MNLIEDSASLFSAHFAVRATQVVFAQRRLPSESSMIDESVDMREAFADLRQWSHRRSDATSSPGSAISHERQSLAAGQFMANRLMGRPESVPRHYAMRGPEHSPSSIPLPAPPGRVPTTVPALGARLPSQNSSRSLQRMRHEHSRWRREPHPQSVPGCRSEAMLRNTRKRNRKAPNREHRKFAGTRST